MDPCPNWAGACSTDGQTLFVSVGESIQDAINGVPLGGEISLAAGSHSPGTTLSTNGKPFRMFGSVDGEGNPTTTLLGPANQRILTVEPGSGSQMQIANLVFSGGTTVGAGGAIWIRGGSSASNPVIYNCDFIGCTAGDGGAIAVEGNSFPFISECLFIFCEADLSGGLGGAISCGSTTAPHLNRCVFLGNQANRGGAVYLGNCTTSIVESSFFYFNTAQFKGGAIATVRSSTLVLNSSFILNGAQLGGAIQCSEQADDDRSEFRSNLIANNIGAGLHVSGGTPLVSGSTINANFGHGVMVADGSPVVEFTQLCNNLVLPQINGSYTDAGFNCISAFCDANSDNIPDCYQAMGMGLPGPGGEAGPLVNTNFSEGEDGLDGWFVFNNADCTWRRGVL